MLSAVNTVFSSVVSASFTLKNIIYLIWFKPSQVMNSIIFVLILGRFPSLILDFRIQFQFNYMLIQLEIYYLKSIYLDLSHDPQKLF